MRLSPTNLFPRPRASSVEASPQNGVLTGGVHLGDLDLQQGVNRALLSGVLINEPQRDQSRDGDPTTVFLISFAAPDQSSGSGSAFCEVEVVDTIADRHRRQLRLGATVLVVGELTGPGGLWADFLVARPPR